MLWLEQNSYIRHQCCHEYVDESIRTFRSSKEFKEKRGPFLSYTPSSGYRTTKENVISLIKYLDFQLETPISLLDLGALTCTYVEEFSKLDF